MNRPDVSARLRPRPGAVPRLAVAASAAVVLATGFDARAVQYEAEIQIENEMDLYEMQLNGEISDTTFATLLELLRVGIDLNAATRDEAYALPGLTYAQVDRILEYRKSTAGILDPAQLVNAEILTREQLEQIQPFLVVGRVEVPVESLGEGKPTKTGGRVRLVSNYTLGDAMLPPAFIQGRAQGLGHLTAGAAVLFLRRMPGRVGFVGDGPIPLQMTEPGPALVLPKAFAQWDTPDYRIVLGTFRLGFGQRLTLDNTGRASPDGVFLDDVVQVPQNLGRLCLQSRLGSEDAPCADRYAYATSDFNWQDGFRGVAASLKGVTLGFGTLRATVFGSYQARGIYQYEVFDRSRCANPRLTTDGCKSPGILYAPADGGVPTSKFAYETLPWGTWDEAAAGGNVSLTFDRGRVGLTAYGASPMWNVPGAQLDFQEWSRTPFGGPYGAVGVDGAWGTGQLDFFLEAARSFDSMSGGTGTGPGPSGGFGVLQRTTASFDGGQELEVSLRYYDRNFANPYARSIAADDETEGQRARNEAGVKARWSGKPHRTVALRVWADAWLWPEDTLIAGTAGRTNLDTYARADWQPVKPLELSSWVQVTNKDLAVNGPGDFANVRNCFDQTLDRDENNRSIPCSGERYRAAARVGYAFSEHLSMALQYQHDLQVDKRYLDTLRTDSLANFETTVRPMPGLRLVGRVRYLNDVVEDDGYQEQSIWSYFDATWQATPSLFARARYDLYVRLDTRDSTSARTPNPENRFRVELETKF